MKFSVITVSYNSAETIAETLESIASQTYNNIEHLIIDGGSKDDTLEIVKNYPHIHKVVSEPDNGIYDAMNKGIDLATGDIIGIINSDDLYINNRVVEQIVACFEADNELGAVYANISFFKTETPNKTERVWVSKPYYNSFFEDGEVPPHPALFVKKEVYNKIGSYFPNFKVASDYEFMLRMLKIHGCKSFHLDRILVRMRLGGQSTSGLQNLILNNKEVFQAWRMNKLTPPIKFFFKRPIKKIGQLLFK